MHSDKGATCWGFLPADFTPPSRFVRAAVFSATAIPLPDRETDKAGVVLTDYTQFTVAHDTQNLRYYYKSYDDQTIRMVDLRKFDLNAKEIKKLSPKDTQPVVDMSAEAK